MIRWRSAAGATARTSSRATLNRPAISAATFPPSSSACAPRGLAPYRTYFRTISGALSWSGWVASTSRAAYSATGEEAGT